jgi:rubrerythrin
MNDERDIDYTCEACGSEADLIIEGFDTVKDVMKLGTVVCEHCSSKEEVVILEEADESLRAVSIALKREKEAHLFYTQAANRTSSEKGRDMFKQLAAFEMNHYRKMVDLCHSLQKNGRWVPYAGQEDLKPSSRIEEAQEKEEMMETDIDALTVAIKKEEEAEALYREMAEKAEDPLGREMFKKLAAEEEVHRRILSDQMYALSNRGIWLWGD